MAMAEFPLPPAVLKNLSDRSFENRKKGAQEVEKVMRRLREEAGPDTIRRVLSALASDYACSLNSNFRKGGLIGLASCAIGLVGGISDHLDLVVPPVLRSFSDQEPRVRYYACESLYNICKISRCASCSSGSNSSNSARARARRPWPPSAAPRRPHATQPPHHARARPPTTAPPPQRRHAALPRRHVRGRVPAGGGRGQ